MLVGVAILLALALALVLALVIGIGLKLAGFLLTGLIVGALARLVLPGAQAVGWLATILYGVAGSLFGALVADAFGLAAILEFLVAIAAAAALIVVLGSAAPRTARGAAAR